MSDTLASVFQKLIAKGTIKSADLATANATQNAGVNNWTISSEGIWLGDPGIGNISFAFESQPYKIAVTGSGSGSKTYSLTIDDNGITGGNTNGGHGETVTFTTTSATASTIATGLRNAVNNDGTLSAAHYKATSAGGNITLQPGPGADPTSVTGGLTAGTGTETITAPGTIDGNGNVAQIIEVANVGQGGTGAFEAFDVLAWNANNVLLGEPDGSGGYSLLYQISDFSLDPSTNPHYPQNLDSTETLVTPCFTAGTRIATPRGEVPVEALRIGDLVLTVAGQAKPVKWLGRRSYGARAVASSPAVQPVRIRAGALGAATPRRDLIVSPQHAMLIDGMLIPAAALVNDVSLARCRNYGAVDYIHIELDDHDAILAEGAPTETFVDDDSRAMFQNAAEYAALYPNEAPRAPCFVAPRVECGEALEEVRQRIAARAGLWNAPAAAPGQMLGHVERIARTDGELCIEGWVLDTANPAQPVRLEAFVGEHSVARIIANRYRADLEAAGMAGGRCAFALTVPSAEGAVVVRRIADGAALAIAAAQEAELTHAA